MIVGRILSVFGRVNNGQGHLDHTNEPSSVIICQMTDGNDDMLFGYKIFVLANKKMDMKREYDTTGFSLI